MPITFYRKILYSVLICSLFFLMIAPDSNPQHNSDSLLTDHILSDSLQIQQNIISLAELERKFKQTQTDLLQKQAELTILNEKIKMKELMLFEKASEIRPHSSRQRFFNGVSIIFFIIGVICLIFSLLKIKRYE